MLELRDPAFKIFHLASSGKKTDIPEIANIKVANFEPSGNQIRKLVLLLVTTDFSKW